MKNNIYRQAIVPLVIASILPLSACSTASKNITAAYTSPMQYNQYDCSQLTAESQRIRSRVSQLGGRLDESASNDKVLTGVGIILFWPVLFALGGTKEQEAQYARLKGEYDAVEQAAIIKKCHGMIVDQKAEYEPKGEAK